MKNKIIFLFILSIFVSVIITGCGCNNSSTAPTESLPTTSTTEPSTTEPSTTKSVATEPVTTESETMDIAEPFTSKVAGERNNDEITISSSSSSFSNYSSNNANEGKPTVPYMDESEFAAVA